MITITLADCLPAECKAQFLEDVTAVVAGPVSLIWGPSGTPPDVTGDSPSDVYDAELFLGDFIDELLRDIRSGYGRKEAARLSRALALNQSSLPR